MSFTEFAVRGFTPARESACRRECLDHFLIFGERHLQRVFKDYGAYFNHARPHQGLGHRIPVPLVPNDLAKSRGSFVQVIPILGGLHHQYRLVA